MSDSQSRAMGFINGDCSEVKTLINEDGNIIRNPCFDEGLNSWSSRGCKILLSSTYSKHERVFAIATDRCDNWTGIEQDITGRVQRKFSYEVVAIVKIHGSVRANVTACLWVQSPNGRAEYISIASVQASDKEWVRLQGKFLINGIASKAVIILAGPPMGTDILVNSLIMKHAMKNPPAPQPDFENVLFGVNIIKNSNLNEGLNDWCPLGSCTLRICTDPPNNALSNCYILATNRTETWMGPSQNITSKLKMLVTYKVVAWVCVGHGFSGPQTINVTLNADEKWIHCGQVQVNDVKWHEIIGSFRLEKQPSKATVYVAGPSPGVILMVMELNIFPVDRKARFGYLKEKTDEIRKRNVILKFPCKYVVGALVKIRQTENDFPFGSHINRSLIENEEFVEFFLKNFNWAVFGNELKWYATEPQQGQYNYKDADELLVFCKKHGIETRGHCIFWEVEDTIQPWLRSLNNNDLMKAIDNRLKGLLSRYKGKFKHYDVNNEMLHGSFYEERLGDNIRASMFKEAHCLDPSSTLFVNDYNIEGGCDSKSTPEMYINQILDLQERGALIGGIGLQGHISNPIGEIICDALDKLSILGIPIWFTELDVAASNEYVRADDLEVVLREAYAHSSVEGIMMWGHLELMCRENSHLINAEGDINEAGKRFLALKKEWLSSVDGVVDSNGEFRFRGNYGNYNIEVSSSWMKSNQSFAVNEGETPLVLNINI